MLEEEVISYRKVEINREIINIMVMKINWRIISIKWDNI